MTDPKTKQDPTVPTPSPTGDEPLTILDLEDLQTIWGGSEGGSADAVG